MAHEETKKSVAEQKPNRTQAKNETTQTVAEAVYPAEELVANASVVFGTRPECVATALKVANVTECTVSKAKEIVNNFLNKEVE